MRKSLRLFSCAVLGAAILAPTVVGNNHAQADSYYGRGYYNNYYTNYGYNYGYNGYYPGYNYNYGYNYGYNGYYSGYNYNYGYNYGYNNYYPNYNYGYNYNYNYGYNNYNPGYNNYNESGTYRYSNGYLYYILSDGSYYVNYNGRWVRGGDYNNNNSGSNNTPTTGYEVLRNDPHYRYENGTHYYLKDNGDYYYYSNGKWVLVKASSTDSEAPTTSTVDSTSSATSEAPSTVDSTSSASSEVASTVDSTSSASSEAVSTVDSTSSASSEVASTVDSTSSASSEAASTVDSTSSASSEVASTVDSTSSASSEVASTVDSSSSATSEAPSTVDSTSVGSSEGASTADSTSEAVSTGNSSSAVTSESSSVATSETGSTSEASSEAPELEKPAYAPETNIDYDKLPKPTLPPTDYRMYSDPRFVDDNGTYYYRVAMTDEENARGIDGYYKWVDGKWRLYNATANDDPEIDPDFHKPAGNDEYMYDDNASSVKLYSENVVGTGKAGEALPFQNVDEFKDYVIKNLAPKFLDNSGWDCKVTWEIEDVDNFNASKGSAWARDYVITANLKSGVDDKDYKDVEFGYVKFVYHVEPTENSDYVEVDSAKAAFNEINAQRTAAGLPALTWSDDLYNSTTLPHAKDISHTYNSDGIVYRRESDGSVVANKWLSSGIRELLMSPDATQAAVACVVAGDGTYYWTLNYQ
ncbi:serine protease [Streptococcus salivarius]|uniref:serine protease n=1 Tax=Streptococcus salivarius TaxID=1304 RepID=UPI001C01321A|nr:serine protease [Streptococcus salivarius]MBT9629098.1 serine protease [Streptococcus salivarius]